MHTYNAPTSLQKQLGYVIEVAAISMSGGGICGSGTLAGWKLMLGLSS